MLTNPFQRRLSNAFMYFSISVLPPDETKLIIDHSLIFSFIRKSLSLLTGWFLIISFIVCTPLLTYVSIRARSLLPVRRRLLGSAYMSAGVRKWLSLSAAASDKTWCRTTIRGESCKTASASESVLALSAGKTIMSVRLTVSGVTEQVGPAPPFL